MNTNKDLELLQKKYELYSVMDMDTTKIEKKIRELGGTPGDA